MNVIRLKHSKPRGVKDFPVYTENPVEPIMIESEDRLVGGTTEELVDRNTGEYVTLERDQKKVSVRKDRLQYIKLFLPDLYTIGNLSQPGIKLLLYVMCNINPNKDMIQIDVDDFLTSMGYAEKKEKARSRVPYYRGITDLLAARILFKKRGPDHVFYINMNTFFNGNRLSKVKKTPEPKRSSKIWKDALAEKEGKSETENQHQSAE